MDGVGERVGFEVFVLFSLRGLSDDFLKTLIKKTLKRFIFTKKKKNTHLQNAFSNILTHVYYINNTRPKK